MATPMATPMANAAALSENGSSWRKPIDNHLTGGIYVHIPFCRKKCPYCHFAIHAYKESRIDSFIETLEREWAERKTLIEDVSSLYFGGGTPSIIDEKRFEKIFNIFPETTGEITLEANPENVTVEKMRFYRELGINRISIGVQSFDDERLKAIGREHSAKDALVAIENTLKAGFENVTIDLMYDLPNQTIKEWEKSVDIASSLDISHISLYNLVFEPGALYYKDRHAIKQLMPTSENSCRMLKYALSSFEDNGFHRYEISAFAKDGFKAVHNTSYWRANPFIGIGPSAFSYYGGARFRNSSHLSKWQAEIESGREPIDFEELLPYPNNVREIFVIGLRLLEGVNLNDFDLPNDTLSIINQLVDGGYLYKNENHVVLTERGTLFYDTVASELI